MNRVVLIPAYKPSEKLVDLVGELYGYGFEVIVVDDGSGYEYNEIFDKAESFAEILRYGENQGKGYALKRGMVYIREHYDENTVIVTADADGQHLAEDIVKVAEKTVSTRRKMVIGCRDFLKKDVPLRSRLGNMITITVFKMATGTRVKDTQTGLRGFKYDMLERLISISGERYEYEMNMLMDIARGKNNIFEVDIHTVYEDNNKSSHFNTVKDSIRIYKDILKFTSASLASFLLDYMMFVAFGALIGITAANIFARIISSIFNFNVNRRLVFNNKSDAKMQALGYFILAGIILAANTGILNILVSIFGLNAMVSKLITEMILFVVSYLVQSKIIFKQYEAKRKKKISLESRTW